MKTYLGQEPYHMTALASPFLGDRGTEVHMEAPAILEEENTAPTWDGPNLPSQGRQPTLIMRMPALGGHRGKSLPQKVRRYLLGDEGAAQTLPSVAHRVQITLA